MSTIALYLNLPSDLVLEEISTPLVTAAGRREIGTILVVLYGEDLATTLFRLGLTKEQIWLDGQECRLSLKYCLIIEVITIRKHLPTKCGLIISSLSLLFPTF